MKRFIFLILCIICIFSGFAQQSFLKTYIFAVNDEKGTVSILGVRPGVVLTGDLTIPGSFTHPETGKKYTVNSLDYNVDTYGPARGTFYGQSEITSVYIPSTIDWICHGAFTGCKKIKEFKVSSNNKDYAAIDGALYEIDQFPSYTLVRFPPARTSTGFTLPEDASYIAKEAFADNYTITTLRLSKFQSLHDQALKGNLGITTFELNESYLYTTDGHFLYTDGSHFSHLKGYGKIIAAVAPKYCIGTALNIPSDITTILCMAGSRASTVIIPSSVKDIFGCAFAGCSFETVTIPATVDEATPYRLFYDCQSLKSVKIDTRITEVGKYMFANCISLSSVSLPSSCNTLEEGCFSNCKSLTSFPGLYNFPVLAPTGGQFAGSGLTSVNIPTSWDIIPERMFMDCADLQSINLNSGVNWICKEAFSGTSIRSLNTGNVNKIDSYSIEPLENTMKKIVIPEHDGVMEMHRSAFILRGTDIDLYIDHKSMGDNLWPYSFSWQSLGDVRIFTSKRSFSYFFPNWKELYVPAESASHYRNMTENKNSEENVYEMFSLSDADVAQSSLTIEPNFSWVKITGVSINGNAATKETGNKWSVPDGSANSMNVKIAYTANDVKMSTEYNISIKNGINDISDQSNITSGPRKIIWHQSSSRQGVRYIDLTGQPCNPYEGQLCIELPE